MTIEESVHTHEYKVVLASIEYWNKNKNNDEVSIMTAFEDGAEWERLHPKNQWVTDRMPEIKENGWSDPVLLLVDGLFLKVSRYCRREDGTTYWNGVEDWNGEEVDAWMPIPELPKGGTQ